MEPTEKHNTYTIHNVYRRSTPEQSEEILAFWKRNNALPNAEEAQKRVKQVVMMVTGSGGEVVGVSTVYPGQIQNDNREYFFYRMFIQPGDRVFGLMTDVTQKTLQFLQKTEFPGKPDGLIIVTENPKLMRKGAMARLRRLGFQFLGKNAKGMDVWLGKVKTESFN